MRRLVYYSRKLCGTLVRGDIIYTNGSPSPLIVEERRPHRAAVPLAAGLLVLGYSLYLSLRVLSRSLAESLLVLLGGATAAAIVSTMAAAVSAWLSVHGVVEAVELATRLCSGEPGGEPPSGVMVICTEDPPRDAVEATCGPLEGAGGGGPGR